MSDYTVKKGIIYSADGLPNPSAWYCDERTSFEATQKGIGAVEYSSPAARGVRTVMYKSFWGEERFYLSAEDGLYGQNLKKLKIYPFGYTGEWSYKGLRFGYNVFTVKNCIFISLKTPGNVPENLKFRLEFFEDNFLDTFYQSNIKYTDCAVRRSWRKSEFCDGVFRKSFCEDESEAAYILIGSDFESKYSSAAGRKHILESENLKCDAEYTWFFCFAENESAAEFIYEKSVRDRKSILKKQIERYKRVSEKAPVLCSPYESLNTFFQLAPFYHEQLKVLEYSGGIKAKTTDYWIWGWDSITSAKAYLYWGDFEFMQKLLWFYMKNSYEGNMVHAYSNNLDVIEISKLPAQGMYIVLLYNYFSCGGEIEPFYEFAKNIFYRVGEKEIGETGFCGGTSLFPDFPHLMKETGEDISAFNGCVFYCAARCMAVLAEIMKDKKTALYAKALSERALKNYRDLFFDNNIGFIAASVDSKTLEKRSCISSCAVKWEGEFVGDITDFMNKTALEFFEKKLLTLCGIRPVPIDDDAYDADANQLHCHWPAMSEYFTRLACFNNRPDLLENFIYQISYFTDKLMCPEGISCAENTSRPETDGWTTLAGTWQGYSIRTWYESVIHSVLGVTYDFGGFVFYPYSGREMKICGLKSGKMTSDISFVGSGGYIDKIIVNGEEIKGTNQIPFDKLKNSNFIEVYRTKQKSFNILSALGAKILDYSFNEKEISFKLHCFGKVYLKSEAGLVIKKEKIYENYYSIIAQRKEDLHDTENNILEME